MKFTGKKYPVHQNGSIYVKCDIKLLWSNLQTAQGIDFFNVKFTDKKDTVQKNGNIYLNVILNCFKI